MTKSELTAFVQAIEAISVEPPKAASTETIRPVVLNPGFWFMAVTQVILVVGMSSQVTGRNFEYLWLSAIGFNLLAIITSLAYDKMIVHIYRVAVTAAPGAKVSPIRAAQIRALGDA